MINKLYLYGMVKKAKSEKANKQTLLKKVRIVFLIIAILSMIAYQILHLDGKYYEVEDYVILSFFISVFIFGWLLDLKNLSNTVLLLFLLVIVSIILIKMKLTLSNDFFGIFYFSVLLFYVVFAVKSIIYIKRNIFLKVLAFVVSIVIILMTLNLLGNESLSYIPNILFVGVTLAMIFGLPSSNYIDWARPYKKLFLKAILIPWIFIFIWSSISFFWPKDFSDNLLVNNSIKWKMKDYKLNKLPGLKN